MKDRKNNRLISCEIFWEFRFCFLYDDPMTNLIFYLGVGEMITEFGILSNGPVVKRHTDDLKQGFSC